jgi:hypothetical protein
MEEDMSEGFKENDGSQDQLGSSLPAEADAPGVGSKIEQKTVRTNMENETECAPAGPDGYATADAGQHAEEQRGEQYLADLVHANEEACVRVYREALAADLVRPVVFLADAADPFIGRVASIFAAHDSPDRRDAGPGRDALARTGVASGDSPGSVVFALNRERARELLAIWCPAGVELIDSMPSDGFGIVVNRADVGEGGVRGATRVCQCRMTM